MSEVKSAKKSQLSEMPKRAPVGNEMLANEIYDKIIECAEAKFGNSYDGERACEAAARELADSVDVVIRRNIATIYQNLLEGYFDFDQKDYFNSKFLCP